MIFSNPPKIFAHKSSIESGNFVTHDAILNKGTDTKANLFHRFCPHRMYPLHNPGEIVQNIHCSFHNFNWDKDGTPLDNPKKLQCGTADIGRSGLITENFVEPQHKWVDDLANETSLEFSHICKGTSTGSWLWMMEIQADLLHVCRGDGVIHPWLSSVENLDDVIMESGNDWILQTCSTGWWLLIYPFTFIEWSKGCLSVNYTSPKNYNNEYGFDWTTQFYYDPSIPQERKDIFEKLENVLHEDVVAIEKQKGDYFPLMKATNRYEDHCVHWGQWVKDHRT